MNVKNLRLKMNRCKKPSKCKMSKNFQLKNEKTITSAASAKAIGLLKTQIKTPLQHARGKSKDFNLILLGQK